MQPDNSISILKQGRHWQREGKLAEAEAAYRQVAETNSSFFSAFQCLGEVLLLQGKLDEAILAFQQAKTLNPKALWGHQRLGEIFRQQNKLNEAIAYFQSAIEISPDFSFAYNSLGECWTLLGNQKEAIAAYQKAVELNPASETFRKNLDKALAEQKISEGDVTSLPTALQQEPSIDEVCEYIWKGLNQLGALDEASTYCKTETQLTAAAQYFTETSQYQIMAVDSLTEPQRDFLEKSGFNTASLQQIFWDDLNLEESYINSFNQGPKIKLAKKSEKQVWKRWNNPDVIQGINFQQSGVETGYFYCVCPVSGKVLRSNQSFVLNWDVLVYRFVGVKTFYLIAGRWGGSKRFVYFPHLELAFTRAQDAWVVKRSNYQKTLNKLKSYAVGCWSLFKSYIDNDNDKETVALCSFVSNIGHFFWNDMSGIYHLAANEILERIDKFLVGPYEYFSVAHIFPEIPPEKLSHTDKMGIDLFKTVLSKNYFCIRVTDLSVKEKLAKRVIEASLRRASPAFLQKVKKTREHFPIVWVGCRYRKRAWVSQVEGTANIIKSLYCEFPNLAIVFGGWSPKENEEATSKEIVELKAPVETFVEQVLELIPPCIQTYNAFGRPNYENILLCNAVDLYISTLSSETAYLHMITNKPGIIHVNSGYPWSIIEPMYVEARENCAPPVLIDSKYIVDRDNSYLMERDYDCDWRAIYKSTIDIINQLIMLQSLLQRR